MQVHVTIFASSYSTANGRASGRVDLFSCVQYCETVKLNTTSSMPHREKYRTCAPQTSLPWEVAQPTDTSCPSVRGATTLRPFRQIGYLLNSRFAWYALCHFGTETSPSRHAANTGDSRSAPSHAPSVKSTSSMSPDSCWRSPHSRHKVSFAPWARWPPTCPWSALRCCLVVPGRQNNWEYQVSLRPFCGYDANNSPWQTVVRSEARHVSLLVAAFGCDDLVRPSFFFEANGTIACVHLSFLCRSLVFRVVDDADWHPGQRLVTWTLACQTVHHVFLADAVYVEQGRVPIRPPSCKADRDGGLDGG